LCRLRPLLFIYLCVCIASRALVVVAYFVLLLFLLKMQHCVTKMGKSCSLIFSSLPRTRFVKPQSNADNNASYRHGRQQRGVFFFFLLLLLASKRRSRARRIVRVRVSLSALFHRFVVVVVLLLEFSSSRGEGDVFFFVSFFFLERRSVVRWWQKRR